MNIRKNIVISVILLLVIVVSQFTLTGSVRAACTGVIYVDANSIAVNPNGCTWSTAFSKLQDALLVAVNGDVIWVADGTYYPDEGSAQTNNSRSSTFTLKNGVAVYGGFAGVETLQSQRNSALNTSVLSGDIGVVGSTSDNAYQVVTIVGTIADTYTLDGFTVTNGNSNGGLGHGGGIYIQNCSPALQNLIITNNLATANGAGIYITSLSSVRASYSSPTLTNILISNNTAARGGGLYTQNSSPVLNNVIFSGNTANSGAGGGMNNQVLNELTDEYSIPLLNNVTFSGNVARGGAGLFNNRSHPVLTNITFSNNTASIRGGAILNEGASPVIRNVTFSGNTAPVGTGGAIRNVQNASGAFSFPQIYNSILWGDGSEEITSDGTGSTTVVDSVVQGGFISGTNIVVTNPLLGTLANNGGFSQTHALGIGSSAIDVGGVNSACTATDQRGVTRPQGNGCDMGAYEVDFSLVPTNTPVYTFTPTPVMPTDTPVPSTATFTPEDTFVPPTSTPTLVFTPTLTFTSTASPFPTDTFTPIPTSALNIYRVATNGVSNSSCGSNWSNPCDLQYALNTLANSGAELWVKQGTYTPGNSRTSTFALKSGVALYGGFSGTETARNQRNMDPSTNNTVLSGDIGTVGVVADNTYSVVSASSVSGSAVLDGFTVTAGNSNGGTGHGGGIFVQDGSPSFSNLIIRNNTASANGGGVYVLSIASLRVNYSSPTLTNVIINNNTAARGGGVYTQNSQPILLNVTFSGNIANGGAGGGMNNQLLNEAVDEDSIPLLTNVTFSGNTANGGGGLFGNNSNPVLTNVTFNGNVANIRGGAILLEGASPTFRNVTFSGNTAPTGMGGTLRNIQNAIAEPSNPLFYNSILWGNSTEEITSDGTGVITIVDSVVQGGCPAGGTCTNMINVNPNLSVLANNGGFTQTQALGAGSSAIDAGGVNSTCPTVDQRGISRPQGGGCDIGAYEFEAPAIPTNTSVPPTKTYTPTDVPTSIPTNTSVPPTATYTPTDVPTLMPTFTPTNTFVPATATFTPTFTATSTNTTVPPTATLTSTFTATSTKTNTPVPPTATFTPTKTATFTPSPTNTPVPVEILYLSSTTDGTAGSVAFADEDILSFNKTTNTWTMYFDGSDVGITSDIDAFFRMADGTILLSLDTDGTVGTFGTVDDSDIIRFTPTSLGTNTAGSFTWYFDGSDVGLTTTAEDIDAIGFAPDGKLVISTLGSFSVTGVSGNDEDLLVFTATALGSTTTGTWALYFDGSDVGLNDATSEQINGIWIEPSTNKIYLTTAGAFSVPGLNGAGSDIFICTPSSLGATTACVYTSYWIGASNGFAGEIADGLHIVK